MSILKTKCPCCGAELNTGIHVEVDTLRHLGPALKVRVICDDCRANQSMLVSDLYIAEAAFQLAN